MAGRGVLTLPPCVTAATPREEDAIVREPARATRALIMQSYFLKKRQTEISAVLEPSNYKIIRAGERGGMEPTTSDRGSGMQFFKLLTAIITVKCP